jgi:RHS repeat-associated protein
MLGSIRAITDSSGEVAARFEYEPFGLVIEESGIAASGAERYTGKPYDQGIGFYFFGARYYDPEVGRFTSRDLAKDGLNWYAYSLYVRGHGHIVDRERQVSPLSTFGQPSGEGRFIAAPVD